MLYPKYLCDKGQKKSPSIDGLSIQICFSYASACNQAFLASKVSLSST